MIEAVKLKTEHLVDPIGIDIKKPRLFWNVKGAVKQTAYYNSIYGRVESNWRLENGKFLLEVTIPFNTTASVVLPNGEQHFVESGKHSFAHDVLNA